jgi:hypothetical protein
VVARRPSILFNLGPNRTIQAMRLNGRERHTIVEATEGVRWPSALVLA